MWTINCLYCTEYVTEYIQRSQIINYMWNGQHCRQLASQPHYSAIYLNESRYVAIRNLSAAKYTATCSVRKPVKKCRTTLRAVQLNPALITQFFEVTNTATRPPRAPPTPPLLRRRLPPQCTSSSSSNILSYTCHALKLSYIDRIPHPTTPQQLIHTLIKETPKHY